MNQRRRRTRVTAALLAGWLLVELIVLILVAQWIGAPATFGTIVAFMLLGTVVLRRGTPRAWATVREAAGAGPTPDHHLSRQAQQADGVVLSNRGASAVRVGVDLSDDVLMLAAGLAMVFPGLVGSLVGLVLLISPVRRVVATRLAHSAKGKVEAAVQRGAIQRITVRPGDPSDADGSAAHRGESGPAPRPGPPGDGTPRALP